jgi:glycosyltransferase involved in cell wall biosynthesis
MARLCEPPRISVVIPAINEEKNLPHVFARLPAYVYEVILVDGHSTDNTVEIARELRPDVQVLQQTGRGKGNALACGFAACQGNIVVMLDADGSADPAEIPRFVDRLRGGADFVKGSRFLQGGGSTDITRLRSLGNRGLTQLVNVLHGTRYTDLCYGYNAFWAHCLPHLRIDRDGFEIETLINIRIAKAGLRVAEIPSFEGSRIHGVSNLHAYRDGRRVLHTIVGELFTGSSKPEPAGGRESWLSQRAVRETAVGFSLYPPTWDGIERRTGQDRRSGEDRRRARGGNSDRRVTFRRWIDPYLLPAPTVPLLVDK